MDSVNTARRGLTEAIAQDVICTLFEEALSEDWSSPSFHRERRNVDIKEVVLLRHLNWADGGEWPDGTDAKIEALGLEGRALEDALLALLPYFVLSVKVSHRKYLDVMQGVVPTTARDVVFEDPPGQPIKRKLGNELERLTAAAKLQRES